MTAHISIIIVDPFFRLRSISFASPRLPSTAPYLDIHAETFILPTVLGLVFTLAVRRAVESRHWILPDSRKLPKWGK
jgi:hypothetical protein